MPGSGTHVYFSVGAAPFRRVLAPVTLRFEVAAGGESQTDLNRSFPVCVGQRPPACRAACLVHLLGFKVVDCPLILIARVP
jgi:hypothetical protein